MEVHLKTVLAEIDSTGTIEKDRRVAIKYVNRDGDVRYMQISKRPSMNKGAGGSGKGKRRVPNMKRNALIPIIDHTDNDSPKDISMFGIVGFNPVGSVSLFYTIKRQIENG